MPAPRLPIPTAFRNGAASPAAWYMFSRARATAQVATWRQHLPTVVPYYAVKSNNDPRLLRWLADEGVKFDCASPHEIQLARQTAAHPEWDIVYANPCKSVTDIRLAQGHGVGHTVVDSVEEVEKLVEGGWRGGVIIRLLVPDAGSAQPFSKKFGAPLFWVPDIIKRLRSTGLRHTGWSFHVGSMCTTPSQFTTAIEVAAEAQQFADRPAEIVDLGGGFVPDPVLFEQAANEINGAMDRFPPTTRWIAEPGRFLSTPVTELLVQVIGRKPTVEGDGWRFTIDESLYGAFSNIPFDGQEPEFDLIAPDAVFRRKVKASVFGRTCDSADCLVKEAMIPELRVGDWLRVRNMGAYTLVSASEFNGFPTPQRLYDDPADPDLSDAFLAVKAALSS